MLQAITCISNVMHVQLRVNAAAGRCEMCCCTLLQKWEKVCEQMEALRRELAAEQQATAQSDQVSPTVPTQRSGECFCWNMSPSCCPVQLQS